MTNVAPARFRRFLPAALLLIASMAMDVKPVQANPISPVWDLDFHAPIAWQEVTTLGDLVVSTPAGLYAIDSQTGNVRWSRNDLANLDHFGFAELAGAPLVVINTGDKGSRTLILNLLDGTLVFDSSAESISYVSSRYFLPRSGNLLVSGYEQENIQPTLLMYDIYSGKRLWSSNALNEGLNKFMQIALAVAVVAAGQDTLQSSPYELQDGTFVMGGMGNIYRFDTASGKVLWQTKYTGGRFEIHQVPQRPELIFVGAEDRQETYSRTQYQAFRLNDGKPTWKKPIRFNKPMNSIVIPLDAGLIVSEGDQDSGKIRLIDYDSGKSLWGKKGKGIKIKGQILDHRFTDAGLILTTGFDSAWTDRGTEFLLYVLDAQAGTLRFEKPLKVKGYMQSSAMTKNGLLYETSHELNVFDPASGTLLNESVLRSKKPLVTAENGQSRYAFNSQDGFLYQLHESTGQIARVSTAPVKFENDDQANNLELHGDRIVLTGQQTVVGFTPEGQVVFNVHHPAPREPGWIRALAWAEGMRAGMASAYAGAYNAAAMQAAAETKEGSVGRQLADEFQREFSTLQQQYAGLAGDYIRLARQRYQASAESRDFVFMMVQDSNRNLALAQVSKYTGQIQAYIPMNQDKQPNYQVDDIGNQIYYSRSASIIEAYRFSSAQARVTQNRK